MESIFEIRKDIINRQCNEYFIDWKFREKLLENIKEIKNEGLFNKYLMSYSIEYHDNYIKLKVYKSIDY